MVGTAKTLCIRSLAFALIVSVANAATVDDIVKQFQEFGEKYLEYRKMPFEPASMKEAAFEELVRIVKANNWQQFYLASIDMETFSFAGSQSFSSQFKLISSSTSADNKLRGIVPSSMFQDHVIKHPNHSHLQEIEQYIKRNYVTIAKTTLDKVAYHYEFFNGQDLTKKNDPLARKEYMLILLAKATE